MNESALHVKSWMRHSAGARKHAQCLKARARASPARTYVEGILRGDRAVLARAMTLIESARATDREIAEQIVEDACRQRQFDPRRNDRRSRRRQKQPD